MRFFSLLLALCVFHGTVYASDSETVVSNIVRNQAQSEAGEGKAILSCSIGVVYENSILKFGFGPIDPPEKPQPPDERTIYEIASVTKVFTALLLAEMVQKGEVSLSDHLSDLLPDGVQFSQGKSITLENLATHRSGIPRLPKDFWDTANRTPDNPYSLFTPEKVFESLSKCTLESRPGENFDYSNFAYALLGNVLAHKKKTTWFPLLEERILKPLRMNETKLELTDSMRQRLAVPHGSDLKRSSNWDLNGFAPGGGLRSSLDDMLRFTCAALDVKYEKDSSDSLKESFELCFRPRADGPDQRKVGLGWMYEPEKDMHWHNGRTGGYSSMLALDRKNKIGVLVLSNCAKPEVDALAIRILEDLRKIK